jgi:PAS domain S-box-containing protein
LEKHPAPFACQQAQETLQIYAAELEELYHHAPCGYHSLDTDGIFIRINDTELKMLGYSAEEIVGKKKFSDLLTPESLPVFQKNFPRFKQRGWVRDLEFEMLRKNGTILPISLSATAVNDAAGNYLYSRCVVLNISERKRTEEVLRQARDQLEIRLTERTAELVQLNRRLQEEINEHKQAQKKISEQATLLDIASDAIFVRDLQQQILFWNFGAEQLYGWTATEVIGKKATELLCFKIAPQMEQILNTVLESGFWQGELQKLTKAGKEVIVNSRMTLVRDEVGNPKSILTVLINYNYRVLTASDGIDALSIYAQHRNEIGVVLMDIQMPSLSGVNAIGVLRRMNPQLKVIAISGLVSNRELLKDLGIEVQTFLSKPYTIKQLLDAIQFVIRN